MKKCMIAAMAAMFFFAQCKEEKKDLIDSESTEKNENPTPNPQTVSTDKVSVESKDTQSSSTNTSAVTPKEIKGIDQNEEGKYTFQYNLEVGKVYPMNIVTEIKSTGTDGKETFTETSKLVEKRSFKILEKKNENYIIQVKDISRSEFITNMEGKTLTYDTAGARPSDENLAFTYDVLKLEQKNPLKFEMTPKGKVLSISGLPALRDKIKAKMKAKAENDEQRSQIDKGIDAGYSEEAKTANIEQNLANILPAKDLKIGESWTDSDSQKEGNNSINFKNDYKLERVENNKVTISSKGEVKSKNSQSQEGMSMVSNGTQTTNGKMVFDQKSGWIQKITISQEQINKETLEFQGKKQNRTITTSSKITVN